MPVMNREQIKKVISVDEPYLWLDEIVELTATQIVARKFLNHDLAIFQSHYTHFPLFPGALQCEAAFQAAAVLIAQTQPSDEQEIPVIARVRETKFRRMARPGDTLEIRVEIDEQIPRVISLRGTVSAAGRTTTELCFTATATGSA